MIYAFVQAFVALFAYVVLAGIVEAVLYSRKGSEAFKWNEHALYIAKIGCVLGLFLLSPANKLGIWDKVAVAIVVWLSYPLVHDGVYFETRRQIDVPKYRWYSFSTDRSNRLEIPAMIRIAMALCAWLMFTIYLLLK